MEITWYPLIMAKMNEYFEDKEFPISELKKMIENTTNLIK